MKSTGGFVGDQSLDEQSVLVKLPTARSSTLVAWPSPTFEIVGGARTAGDCAIGKRRPEQANLLTL